MKAVYFCKMCQTEYFLSCRICGQVAKFIEKSNDAVLCQCGHGKITEVQCSCGNPIAIAQVKLKPSFKRHWMHWTWIITVMLFLLQVVNYSPRFRNDNAVGAIANQIEGETAGFAAIVLSVVGSLLVSWLPALVTQHLFSPKEESGE